MKRLLLFILAFLYMATARASDTYFAASSAGSNNGTSCANAYAYNDGTHGLGVVGTWVADANLHLCGTFTASGNSSGYITAQASGSSGHPITLKFETGAILQAPYWGSNGAIYASGKSYITVDGGTNGLIQATLNGTSGGTCPGGTCTTSNASGIGVFLSGANNIEVKSLTIANLYVRTSAADTAGGGGISPPYGVEILNGHDITVDGVTFHDMNTPIYPVSTGTLGPNLNFNTNTFYNANCAICGGSGNTGVTIQGPIYYFNNTVHDFEAWDSGASDYFHHDAFDLWNVHSGATFTGSWFIYNNTVSGLSNSVNCTADIYMDMETTPASAYGIAYVFNNVLLDGSCDDGTVYDKSGRGVFYNNTMPTSAGNNYILNNGAASPGAPAFVNNIFAGTTYAYEVDSATPSSSDYNDNVSSSPYQYKGSTDSLATMRGLGFETNTITAAPNLSAIYVPNAGSPLISAGSNLYATCNGQANPGLGALCYDKAGVARPTSGAWDIGAYQSGAVASVMQMSGVKLTLGVSIH